MQGHECACQEAAGVPIELPHARIPEHCVQGAANPAIERLIIESLFAGFEPISKSINAVRRDLIGQPVVAPGVDAEAGDLVERQPPNERQPWDADQQKRAADVRSPPHTRQHQHAEQQQNRRTIESRRAEPRKSAGRRDNPCPFERVKVRAARGLKQPTCNQRGRCDRNRNGDPRRNDIEARRRHDADMRGAPRIRSIPQRLEHPRRARQDRRCRHGVDARIESDGDTSIARRRNLPSIDFDSRVHFWRRLQAQRAGRGWSDDPRHMHHHP